MTVWSLLAFAAVCGWVGFVAGVSVSWLAAQRFRRVQRGGMVRIGDRRVGGAPWKS